MHTNRSSAERPTCIINSSLQAFAHQPLLAKWTPVAKHHICRHHSSPKQLRARFRMSASREPDPITSSPLGAPQVLCYGEALFDLFSESPTADKSDPTLWKALPGGAPANLSVALAKLSTASAIVGNVGDDDEGRRLRKVLADINVNTDGLETVEGHPTRRVFVRRDENGERAFVGFSHKNDEFADAATMDMDSLPGVLFYAAQILVTGTLPLAFPGSGASLKEVVEVAKMCKLRIFVDVNWRDVFWKGQYTKHEARERILDFLRDSPGADFVKISQDEVAFLFDGSLAKKALEQPEAVLHELGGQCVGVIITAGADGAAYAYKGGMEPVSGRVAAVKPKGAVVDTTGAGDAFLGGFLSEMLQVGGLYALGDEDKAKQIAKFAAAVSSFVVARPGAIDSLPTRDEVELFLETEESKLS